MTTILPGSPSPAAVSPANAATPLSDLGSESTEAQAAPAALLQVPPVLRAALQQRGYSSLTPIQEQVVAQLDSRGNLRLVSHTGSGKTVAIGLALAPSLLSQQEARAPLALVITPTRELAQQVSSELSWLFAGCQIRVDAITGGTSVRAEQRRLRHPPTILVATPGRLLDHLSSGSIELTTVHEVVLDEADQMLDLGFRDELDAIVGELPAERRSHLVSATFPSAVQALARRFQGEAQVLYGASMQQGPDIEHCVHLVRTEDRYAALVNVLLHHQGDRVLVFVRRRADAAELAEALAGDDFAALPISGDMAQAQRQRALDAFKNGSVRILVATDVAARGIHVEDIKAVVHYELPSSPDVYTHRSGRTGRAGRAGRSIALAPVSARRRVARLLGEAKVQARWISVPTPHEIRRQLGRQTRRQLHALLEQGAPEAQLTHARRLLAEGDAEALIACLLELAEPKLPRQPAELSPVRLEPARARQAHSDGYVRYFLNWGSQNGANPQRVLSHVCRRGAVERQCVGAIRIGPRSSTVEIRREVVDTFERRTRKPDARDPAVRIRRDSDQGFAGSGSRNDARPWNASADVRQQSRSSERPRRPRIERAHQDPRPGERGHPAPPANGAATRRRRSNDLGR